MRRARRFLLAFILVLFLGVLAITYLVPEPISTRTRACKRQLTATSTALQLYRASYDGENPPTLQALVDAGVFVEREDTQHIYAGRQFRMFAYNPNAAEGSPLVICAVDAFDRRRWLWLQDDGHLHLYDGLERRWGLSWPIRRDGRMHSLKPVSSRRMESLYHSYGPSDGWVSLRGGPTNNALGMGTATGELKWVSAAGEGICSTPVIARDGTVYLAVRAANREKVVALDAATGKAKWTRELRTVASQVPEQPAISPSSPAGGGNGLIYVRLNYTEMHALRVTDGTSEWVLQADGVIQSSPNICADGIVYFGTDQGRLYAVNGSTGKAKWTRKMEEGVLCTPAVGTNKLYIGGSKGLLALDAGTGADVWALPVKDIGLCTPAIGPDGNVYIGASSHCGGETLFAVDGDTGELKWKLYAGRAVMPYPASGADNSLYIASHDNDKDWSKLFESLYAFEGSTGRVIWHRKFHSPLTIGSPPVVDSEGNLVLVLSGKLAALDGKTGKTRWAVEIKAGSFASAPAIGVDGTVYVGTSDGNLYAIR